jgi:hypothetical protein
MPTISGVSSSHFHFTRKYQKFLLRKITILALNIYPSHLVFDQVKLTKIKYMRNYKKREKKIIIFYKTKIKKEKIEREKNRY